MLWFTCGVSVGLGDGSSIDNMSLRRIVTSRVTPRFLTDLAGSMILPRRLTGHDDCKEVVVRSLNQHKVFNIRSVLSGLNLGLLFPIHTGCPQGN